MSSLVQVAASTSEGARMLTGNQSPASTSSAGEGRERAFSNHLKAQQNGNQNKASDHARKESESAGKPEAAGSEAESSIANEGRDHAASKVADGGSAARKASSEADSRATEERGVMASSGLQNTPSKGLKNQIIVAPISTMGEQVQALLAAGTASSEESPAVTIDTAGLAVTGNESPSGDDLLPQQVAEPAIEGPVETAPVMLEMTGADLEVAPLGDELVPATVLPVAAEVSSAQVAAALRSGEGVKAGDAALVSPAPVSQTLASEQSTKAGPLLSGVVPELLRASPGKHVSGLSGMLDNEVDAELELGLNPGKAVKASLLEGPTPKLSATTPVVTEALSNGSGPKDNFEQVRQNIMAALAGKSEIPSPVSLAVAGGGHETSEGPSQGLNFSNVSSTLAAAGAESAKYTATQESTPPRFFTLQTPAGQPGWDVEVGNRIRWMVGQNNTGVELRLNPPELGSIEVKVATEGERTSVTFFAANPAARDALELALPRLREMFADSGMQLANADVSDQSLQQEREQLSDPEGVSGGGDTGEAMTLEAGPGLVLEGQTEGRGVIDYYI
ncbi:MAG: flagellar hook-length control protein FliK [Gammaproteobacteria bacterium]|nr:flagellar hook-length control protein FliK [Gammaproteobacteria bacterium]